MVRRRPSPAFIISVIALTFAVGGGLAFAKLSENKKDKKIANKVVTKRAKKLSVLHATTADNATNSTNSTNVGGLTPVRFSALQPAGTASKTIATAGPFTITMGCTAGNAADIAIHTPSNVSSLAESSVVSDGATAHANEDEELAGTPSTVLLSDGATRSDGTSTFGAALQSGQSVEGSLVYKPGDETFGPGGAGGCFVTGSMNLNNGPFG